MRPLKPRYKEVEPYFDEEVVAILHVCDLDPQLQQVRVLGKGAKTSVVPLNREARKAWKHIDKVFNCWGALR